MRSRVIIYCDGACSPNPGIGGWGALLISEGGHERELSGAVEEATNNRMELLGAIEALRALTRPCDIALHTDSNKPVENQDLWLTLVALTAVHTVEWNWVPGHADCDGNNRCDALAVAARERLRHELRAAREDARR